MIKRWVLLQLLELAEGDVITFVNEPCIGTREKIYMSYQSFAQDVNVGEQVLIDDGKLIFEVVETNGASEVKGMATSSRAKDGMREVVRSRASCRSNKGSRGSS